MALEKMSPEQLEELSNLSREQIEQLKDCHTPEEAFAFVKKCGLKLTNEQLEAVSGGWELDVQPGGKVYTCDRCGAEFTSEMDCDTHIAVEHAWKDCKPNEWIN